jgi:putative sigma-54 modulation protein
MNVDVKGVHMDVNQRIHDYLNKKLKRLHYADDLIVDLLFTLTQETRGYSADVTINFRWGVQAHIKVELHNLIKAIDQLFDKMDEKITKEKEKIQDHA